MCTVLLQLGVNPIAVNKYIISVFLWCPIVYEITILLLRTLRFPEVRTRETAAEVGYSVLMFYIQKHSNYAT